MRKIDTCVLPAFLASALVNGDTSGFNNFGFDWETYKKALKLIEGYSVIDCGAPFFSSYCDIDWGVAGDVCVYTLLKNED